MHRWAHVLASVVLYVQCVLGFVARFVKTRKHEARAYLMQHRALRLSHTYYPVHELFAYYDIFYKQVCMVPVKRSWPSINEKVKGLQQ